MPSEGGADGQGLKSHLTSIKGGLDKKLVPTPTAKRREAPLLTIVSDKDAPPEITDAREQVQVLQDKISDRIKNASNDELSAFNLVLMINEARDHAAQARRSGDVSSALDYEDEVAILEQQKAYGTNHGTSDYADAMTEANGLFAALHDATLATFTPARLQDMNYQQGDILPAALTNFKTAVKRPTLEAVERNLDALDPNNSAAANARRDAVRDELAALAKAAQERSHDTPEEAVSKAKATLEKTLQDIQPGSIEAEAFQDVVRLLELRQRREQEERHQPAVIEPWDDQVKFATAKEQDQAYAIEKKGEHNTDYARTATKATDLFKSLNDAYERYLDPDSLVVGNYKIGSVINNAIYDFKDTVSDISIKTHAS